MSDHFFPEQVFRCVEENPDEGPKKKQEPTKGGFYGFGKNSKSAIGAISKDQQAEKALKLKEYRDLIGQQAGGDSIQPGALGGIGATSTKSLLQNEHLIEQALKRAKVAPQQMMQVTVRDKATGDEIGEEFGGVGGGHPKQRPQTAQAKSLEGAQAVQPKQYNPFPDSAGGGTKAKKVSKKPSRQGTQMSQAMNQSKTGRPAAKPTNTFTEVYKSQHHMEDDFARAKAGAFDESLVLAGNPQALSAPQTSNAYHAEQRRKDKEAKEAKAQAEKEAAAAKGTVKQPDFKELNKQISTPFKAMPPPMRCPAATKFYRGQANRQAERLEKERIEMEGSTQLPKARKPAKAALKAARPTTAKWADTRAATIAQAQYYRENPTETQLKGGTSSFMVSLSVRPAVKSKRPTTATYRAGTKGNGVNALEERSRSRSRRRHDEMYGKAGLFDRKGKTEAQKREDTKKELKSLLTKYIGGENAKYAVTNAAHTVGIMNARHDKATDEMRKCNEEFAATRKSVRELEAYKEIDKFNSIQYEKDLMKKSRLRYGDPDSILRKEIYTSNEAVEQGVRETRRAELLEHLADLQAMAAQKERQEIEKNLRAFTRERNEREMAKNADLNLNDDQ